uniref:Uncharacterized protein n=1 Tax=Arundo donax TaxID=35708 RepID=A0A0A8ZQZ5_ARUDO
MCHKNDCLVLKCCHGTIIEKGSSCMRIDSAEWIIEKVNVCVIVDRSGKLNPLLLPSTHVQASLPDLCEVAMWKVLNVLVQCATPDGLLILLIVHRLPEEHIVAHRATLDP